MDLKWWQICPSSPRYIVTELGLESIHLFKKKKKYCYWMHTLDQALIANPMVFTFPYQSHSELKEFWACKMVYSSGLAILEPAESKS